MKNLIFYSSIIFLLISSCKKKSIPGDPLTSSLLNEQWELVAKECNKKDSLFLNHETVGILGHTLIMLNRNNESYILLKALDLDSIKTNWLDWTDKFVQSHPKNAVSHYLRGDALMRNNEKVKALEHFSKSLIIQPKFALAYNARGVVYAMDKDLDNAYSDFNEACTIAPSIAEFFASKATALYNNDLLKNVDENFSKALNISPSFALAINGKASITYLSNPNKLETEEVLDSTIFYLNEAKYFLNHPVFSENSRKILLELEKDIYTNQDDPNFRASDFLDWDLLVQLSSFEGDLFKYALKKYLPNEMDAKIISQINNALGKNNLFGDYLNGQYPDSLKNIIRSGIKNNSNLLNSKRKDVVKIINRLILEDFYTGLIAQHLDRGAGTTITREFIRNIGQDVYQGIDRTLRNATIGIRVNSNGKITGGLGIGLSPIADAIKHTSGIISAKANTHRMNRDFNKLHNNPINQIRQNHPEAFNKALNSGNLRFLSAPPPRKQGGLKFDSEGLVNDFRKSSSLTCLNSLGYE